MESLCTTCRFVREIRTPRSCFLLCRLSDGNPDYPKYPPQPVRRCQGYEPANRDETNAARLKALEDLSALDQELGLGY